MNTDFFALAIAVLIFAVLIVFLKQQNKEIGMLAAIVGGVFIFIYILKYATSSFEFVNELIRATKLPSESILILIKALGIAYITQFICELCKDVGEGALAAKLEIAGKLTILVISIPLFSKILELITSSLG